MTEHDKKPRDGETQSHEDNVNDGVVFAAVKAIGDWELDVLAVPYGGQNKGKDAHGEYFTQNSNLYLDKFKTPLVHYYHGYDPDGNPQGSPEQIGDVKNIERRLDGVWYRVALNKTSEYARRVWESAKQGLARASSGTLEHLRRVADSGEILHWGVAEISLFDTNEDRQPANTYAVALPVMKAVYKQAGLVLPDLPDEASGTETEDREAQESLSSDVDPKSQEGNTKSKQEFKMDAKEILELLDKRDEAKEAKAAAVAEAEAAAQAKIDEAVKAAEAEKDKEIEALKATSAEGRRLDSDKGDGIYIAKYSELWKYDKLSAEDQAVLVGVLDAAQRSGQSQAGATKEARAALGVKLSEHKGLLGSIGRGAMKAEGIKTPAVKANEIDYSTYTSYGKEWVGTAYSTALWESIRAGTAIVAKVPSLEVPPGHSTVVIPLESTDPTYYHVAEATTAQSTGMVSATVTSSRFGTANNTLSLNKMGARVIWGGELEEDSLVPFVSQLRKQLETAGAEQLEHAVIDGDTATAASSNINDIGNSSTQTATNLHVMFDGFRKNALLDNSSANARDGGALAAADYLETLKLLGTAGLNGADPSKVEFIVDPNVAWKNMELAEVKTRDVFARPTVEQGMLSSLWGFKINTSYFMHFKSAARKANADGKVDQTTTTNNTKGAILAVVWGQWLMGYRRRMTIETTRVARADATEIVALMRVGLLNRDNEAAAISYNITV